jgi:chromosome segregation ATPase
MSPQAGGTFDPAELAIGLAQVRADQTILQREVATNVQNLTSTLHSVQAELRHVGEQLTDVARLQQQQVNHSEGLDRAFKAIEKLANSFDSWRERHEGENKVTSDCVTEFRGQIRGAWLAGGLVVMLASTLSTVAWNRINERFAENDKALAEARAERVAVEARRQSAHDRDMARVEKEMAEHRAALEKLQIGRGLR